MMLEGDAHIAVLLIPVGVLWESFGFLSCCDFFVEAKEIET